MADDEIRAALAAELARADFETDTLKIIRQRVVARLDLPADFFKTNAEWKRVSTEMADAAAAAPEDPPAAASPRADSGPESPPPAKPDRKKAPRAPKAAAAPKPAAKPAKAKPAAKPAVRAKPASSPSQDQIDNLKTWIVRCGVRKQWKRELEPFTTAAAQIAHLKAILADLGMAGPRYSLDKARKIKAARDLAAEVAQLDEPPAPRARRRPARPAVVDSSGDEGAGDSDDDASAPSAASTASGSAPSSPAGAW
ncbi:uncharacterized protein V1510DRAFT_431664 [Dipodascopsis tothii]|uniref:uncharacterized protein n=1 Tax=Dipodascopsis tothii TaxID=44089 RepID=UPI0034CFABE6